MARFWKAYARGKSVELVYTPVGREAFVFFVNARNPVDGLTSAQLRDIYTGAITRWDVVGGTPTRIQAFQRNAGSGSQSAFLRFMGDGGGRAVMTPPDEENRPIPVNLHGSSPRRSWSVRAVRRINKKITTYSLDKYNFMVYV